MLCGWLNWLSKVALFSFDFRLPSTRNIETLRTSSMKKKTAISSSAGCQPTAAAPGRRAHSFLRQPSSLSSSKLAPTSGFFHANFFRPLSRRILSRRKTVRRVSSQLSCAGIYPFRDVCVRWCFRINPLAGRVDLSVLLLCQSSSTE